MLLLQPRDRLLKAFGRVAVAGIVGRMLGTYAGDLLLELGEALEFGFRDIGEVIGPFLKLAG
jgi:hypothetical protein